MDPNDELANLIVQNNNNNGNGIFEQQQNINNIAAGLEQAQGHQRIIPPNKNPRGEEDLSQNKRIKSSGGSKKRKSKRRRTHKKRRTHKRRK